MTPATIRVRRRGCVRRPLLAEDPVSTAVVIGPKARRPRLLDIPLLVTDMSFDALSTEAKVALALGAEAAGTAICSGEGGMLPAEKHANSRYLYELASGRFGLHPDNVLDVQAFHFKFGQAAKTGTGGHRPGAKVSAEIAAVRGLAPGQDAVSPATFPELVTPAGFRELVAQVREMSGGIPIGTKLTAQHIAHRGGDIVISTPPKCGTRTSCSLSSPSSLLRPGSAACGVELRNWHLAGRPH